MEWDWEMVTSTSVRTSTSALPNTSDRGVKPNLSVFLVLATRLPLTMPMAEITEGSDAVEVRG